MKNFFELLNDELMAGRDVTMVSVTASSGSTPRGAGARMIVGEKGRIYGTIGGGAVEYLCQQKAQEVLKTKKSFNESYMLRQNQVQDLGMICGGDVACFFQYISGQDEKIKEMIKFVLDGFEKDEDIWLIMDITDGAKPSMGIVRGDGKKSGDEYPKQVLKHLDGKSRKYKLDSSVYFIEKINQNSKVYIFGGGHVAQQLVPTLHRIGFNCIVLEDRVDFSKKELFQGVVSTRIVDMQDLSDLCEEISENDYICIMTRGHKDDYIIQRQVLKTPARYIGVIGSRRKTAGVMEKLRNDGYNDEDLARITAPIGIPLDAETPAEIAISIAGQLINERAKDRHEDN